MLKVMRRFRHPIFTLVIVAVIATTMSGFGVNLASGPSQQHAIKVGDRVVSFERFSQIRRSIDSRYRQMFGENADQFMKSLGINVSQQAVDAAIDAELMLDLAEKLKLQASDKAVQEMLVKDLFQGQFDKQKYLSFLASQGMSAQQFEENLKQDVIRKQISDIFQDSSTASKKEARAQLSRDKTSFSFNTASLTSSELVAQVAEPENSEVEKIYDQNLSDYQTPAKVSYKFFVLSPDEFKSKVQVAEEEIEFEYTDNQASYRTDPQIRYSQIVLKLDPKSSEQQKDAVRKKASELAQKIKDGASFEDLARTNSQDIGTAMQSGDAGWFSKNKLPEGLADKLNKLEKGVVSDPVETASAVYILRADDSKEPAQKELAEVREEIISKIKEREAPSVLALESMQSFDGWADKSIEQLALQFNVQSVPSVDAFDSSRDYSPALEGLTARVIGNAAEKKQLVELKDSQIFVEITNTIEEGVKPLPEVKTQIVQQIKLKQALALAKEKMETAKKALLETTDAAGFTTKAKSLGLKTEELKDQTKSSVKGAIAESSIRDRIFTASKAPQVFDQVFETSDALIVVQATEIKAPTADEIEKGLEAALKELTSENDQTALESYLTKAKAQVKIDIQPSLLSN